MTRCQLWVPGFFYKQNVKLLTDNCNIAIIYRTQCVVTLDKTISARRTGLYDSHWRFAYWTTMEKLSAFFKFTKIGPKFHMWVDYDVPNWFLTSENLYRSPFSKWPPQYRQKFNIIRFQRYLLIYFFNRLLVTALGDFIIVRL